MPLRVSLCFFLLASLGLLDGKALRAQQERPNILLLIADDLGYADLGSYGGEIETPNLDRLAAGGVRMSHFYVTPMCVTSRVAMLAGMPYNRAGRGDYDNAVPFVRLLRDAGYATSMTGKWHAGNPKPSDVFDHFFGFLEGSGYIQS